MRRVLVLGLLVVLASGAMALPSQAADFDPVPHLVRDIHAGGADSDIVDHGSRRGAVTGSRLVFGAFDGTDDAVWTTDGTTGHTQRGSTVAAEPTNFVAFSGRVYFTADSPHGKELWKTDGTVGGTAEVTDLNPGAVGSDPADLTVVGNYLYFSAVPAGSAKQLFRLAASPAIGPSLPPEKISSFTGTTGIEHLTRWGSKVVFSSNAAGDGLEPWISDGTGPGTKQLRDIFAGATGSLSFSSDPGFTPMGAYVYFAADTPSAGIELWRSDGTGAAGTTLVADLLPGTNDSSPADLFAFGSRLLFRTLSSASGDVVWASDGTSAGTHVLASVRGGGTDDNPTGWTLYKGAVYFSGSTPALGAELYRTLGTPATTAIFKNLNTGTSNSSPQEFRIVDGLLLFNAKDAGHGAELWRSDGTVGGTRMVKDLFPGTGSSYPEVLGVVGNTLFLDANDGTHGYELWAYTAQATATRAAPKASYTKAKARARAIRVTVKVTGGSPAPTGTVVLKKGTTTIGTATLSGGKASVRIKVKLPKGKTKVRAYYSGSVRGSSSHSALFVVKVT